MITALSRKIYRRIVALGLYHWELSDVEGELSYIYLKVLKSFDNDKGFKISTYFYRSACNHMNRIISAEIKKREALGMSAIDSEYVDSQVASDDCPISSFEQKDLIKRILKRLGRKEKMVFLSRVLPPLSVLVATEHDQKSRVTETITYDALRSVFNIDLKEMDRVKRNIKKHSEAGD